MAVGSLGPLSGKEGGLSSGVGWPWGALGTWSVGGTSHVLGLLGKKLAAMWVPDSICPAQAVQSMGIPVLLSTA